MASLDQTTFGGRNCWRVRFYLDKRRCSVGLGSFDEADSRTALGNIEHLVDCRNRGRLPSVRVTRWLESIPSTIHDRLAGYGLCDPRRIVEKPRTVLAFMRGYIAGRTDWKKSCNHLQSVDHLERFLGKDVPLAAITRGDCERFHRWMMADTKGAPRLSPNTAGQHVKRCRQMFRAAIDDKLIEENPFAGIKLDLRSDRTKNQFIGEEASAAILEACPNQEWRVLFALARYGGLRCPSETLGLRWSDIDWGRDRFLVRSPKTERSGKGQRVVPLFPELRRELGDLFALAAPGVKCKADSPVITRYRSNDTNLRTQFHRIIERAGLVPWPKPFMTLRATRRTELERHWPNHVLNEWFGHTAAVAEQHYLQVTDSDYARATGRSVDPFVDPSAGSPKRSAAIADEENTVICGLETVGDGVRIGQEYTPLDSNQ